MKVQTKKSKKAEEKNYEEYTLNDVTMRVYESGFASLSIAVEGGTFIVNGKIRESNEGKLFFSFPSYKGSDGKYYNNVYTMGDDLRADLELLVKHLTDD